MQDVSIPLTLSFTKQNNEKEKRRRKRRLSLKTITLCLCFFFLLKEDILILKTEPIYPPTPPANVRCFECDLSVGRGVSALDFRNTVSGGFIAPVSLSERLSVENNRNLTIEMWLRTDHVGQVGKFQALAARYSRAPGPRGNIFVDFVLQTTPQGTLLTSLPFSSFSP